ncbi:MAG: hypothetical protein JXO22_15485 [Phycisphaerae bacterium]|nr:hypothetical protein [Phycisphaerae bacterium]
MARYQYPNPIDLVFHAGDVASRRVGLPGSVVHVHVELGETVDLDGLREAVRALHRVYPVTGARRGMSLFTGHPRWRLDVPAWDMHRVVRLHDLGAASIEAVYADIEALFNRRTDCQSLPAVQFHVFRAAGYGDVVVMRWPHSLMDGRGAFTVLEEIERLYREKPDPDTLTSAGDERRRDYQNILGQASWLERVRFVRDFAAAPQVPDRRKAFLATGAYRRPWGPIRIVLRRLTAAQTTLYQENARRAVGKSLSGDFIRACALLAMHRVMVGRVSDDAVYTTMVLIDNRRGDAAGAVCWNLTGVMPVAVPATAMTDRSSLSALIHQQKMQHFAQRRPLRDYAAYWLLMQPPSAYVAEVMRAGLTPSHRPPRGIGDGTVPSMSVDLLGPFSRPITTWCGAPFLNHLGYTTVPPQPGFALYVNQSQDLLNIAGVYFPSRVPPELFNHLIDEFVTVLLERD